MQSFSEVIESIRKTSINAREVGARFEVLIQRWFLESSLFRVKKSWLWSDFAHAVDRSAVDLGIDVVLEMEDGEFWAVQCKLYGENTKVDEDAVTHFLSHQGWIFEYNSKKCTFSRFLWVDTDAIWNKNAESHVRGRENFTRIGMSTLEQSNVDWGELYRGRPAHVPPKKLRDYQVEVLQKSVAYYKNAERGKIIMACGTGKTLTAQRIAEAVAGTRGSLVLYCVPSIALLGQTYQSWAENAIGAEHDESRPAPIFAIGVCSDNEAMKKSKNKGEGVDAVEESSIDSVLPATTNTSTVRDRLIAARGMYHNGMTVVFTTYQSLQVVSDAQAEVLHATGGEFGTFDMIICDEAHRTTGAAKEGLESSFMKVHDEQFIHAKKRLYMTATPRIYTVNAKSDAKKLTSDAVVCSMDDEKTYGAEIARISFGQAVNLGCLSDYKVIILTVDPKDMPEKVVSEIENKDKTELDLTLSMRFIGAMHGLSKQLIGDGGRTLAEDPKPCTRALLFASKIGSVGELGTSKNIEAMFPEISHLYLNSKSYEERKKFVSIECKHVDGTMNTSERNDILRWLAGDNADDDIGGGNRICRVVSNVRCLSEGVDVPALDAVVFMAPKKSQIDIVQSVGRVMRNFRRGEEGGKKYGYIVLPVALRPGEDIGEALEESDRFKEVWNVLCALRSHDENFNAQVNAIRLNMADSSKINVGKTGDQRRVHVDTCVDVPAHEDTGDVLQTPEDQKTKIRLAKQLELFRPDQEKILAKLVDKVGTRNYWEGWASDVGKVTLDILAHMRDIIERNEIVQAEFDRFVAGLKENINDTIDREQAAEMLGQHIVIGPIFDALFADYQFNENNAVSKTMARMVDTLHEYGLGKDTTVLRTFYASIKNQIGDIVTPKGRQQLIKDLYNRFFAVAFPKTVQRLGIVYTPVECVDFILHSVEALMQRHFGRSLSDENVHILDPFVGTGTFITRLLQSGIIKDKDLERKYLNELHCNEIVLLAYYVADVNIETTFHALQTRASYLHYDRICLTDTFETYERGQRSIFDMFRENTEQIEAQRQAPIQVIVGNPPYSAGQKNANDNNQNLKYPKLDARIAETYVAGSTATNKNAMYDSYIRAFRWASDRIDDEHGGVVGFVTNGGWIDGNTGAGVRKSFYDEFDAIYIVNLRGGVRGMAGDAKKKEGDPFFGAIGGKGGCMATICLTFLVKGPHPRPVGHPLSINGDGENVLGPHPRPVGHPLSINGDGEDVLGVGNYKSLRDYTPTVPGEISVWNWGESNKVTGGVKINSDKLELAKKYRLNPTAKEAEVWEWLRSKRLLGLKWRRQQLIDGYIADFYCPELFLALELDGNVHDSESAQAYDEYRNQVFASKGIRTLRISNECTKSELTSMIEAFISPSPFMERGLGGEVQHNCHIYYTAVADYMTREAKLDYLVQNKSIASKSIEWKRLTPDEHGDWLNKRVGGVYDTYIRIGDKKDKSGEKDKVFGDCYSNGLKTNRDSWCYNYSKSALKKNITECIDYYNEQRELYAKGEISEIPRDATKISWARALENLFTKNREICEDDGCYTQSVYRPYVKANCYYAKDLNEMIYLIPSIFPFSIMRQAGNHDNRDVNRVICVQGLSGKKDFSSLMTNCIPDLNMLDAGAQCFPLYVYQTEDNSAKQKKQRTLFDGGERVEESACSYERTSGVTDWIFDRTRQQYGRSDITKEDIFYYVYGILHCPAYREKYQNDFKKALPRIPFVERYEDFAAFVNAGRELGDLHCHYESCPMNEMAQVCIDGEEGERSAKFYEIDKLRPVGKGNFTELKYNGHISIKNIPPEAHEYIVNGRSPLGWIIDQYEVSIDKDSGIKNDPNDWCREHGNPRYILELILRVIEVSVRTVKIVAGLPRVDV